MTDRQRLAIPIGARAPKNWALKLICTLICGYEQPRVLYKLEHYSSLKSNGNDVNIDWLASLIITKELIFKHSWSHSGQRHNMIVMKVKVQDTGIYANPFLGFCWTVYVCLAGQCKFIRHCNCFILRNLGKPPGKRFHKKWKNSIIFLFFVQLNYLKSTFTFGKKWKYGPPPPPSYQKVHILNCGLFDFLFLPSLTPTSTRQVKSLPAELVVKYSQK